MTEFRTKTEIIDAIMSGLIIEHDTVEEQARHVVKKLEDIGLYFDASDLALL